MTDIIKIGNKDVGMMASGSSIRIYRRIFGRDFMTETQEDPPDTGIYQDMGFVMAMQYEVGSHQADKKTIEDYYNWCDQFTPLELYNAQPAIISLWAKSSESTSNPKK